MEAWHHWASLSRRALHLHSIYRPPPENITFGRYSPFLYNQRDKRKVVIVDTRNSTVVHRGVKTTLPKPLTGEIEKVLNLLGGAHYYFWRLSPMVKENLPALSQAYAITVTYSDGLVNDLLSPHCHRVTLDKDWIEVSDTQRELHVHLDFDNDRYSGAWKHYVVRDERLSVFGSYCTARTIEPWIVQQRQQQHPMPMGTRRGATQTFT